ncbi:hypothetical protein SAMN05216490_1860 [Mucilaginibacter mallensis]|uniref:Uncharacterized protein n=1 Tax=Mucilaginibacter mallensis TaxID=652787 RepID=A0A1H1V9Q9_MUCMA|nr:hypothetical protein SAMN05216490_1860 [Mucilaginibacter mallensis]
MQIWSSSLTSYYKNTPKLFCLKSQFINILTFFGDRDNYVKNLLDFPCHFNRQKAKQR